MGSELYHIFFQIVTNAMKFCLDPPLSRVNAPIPQLLGILAADRSCCVPFTGNHHWPQVTSLYEDIALHRVRAEASGWPM